MIIVCVFDFSFFAVLGKFKSLPESLDSVFGDPEIVWKSGEPDPITKQTKRMCEVVD
jgi:hypothetical protein